MNISQPANISSNYATRLNKDIVLFGQLPSAIAQLLCETIEPPAEDASSRDNQTGSQIFQGSPAAVVSVPFPAAVNDLQRYHRSLVDHVFSLIKEVTVKSVIHLSRLGAHRPDKTGPILGCYEMERHLNWLRNPSLLHLRCGFFPDEVIKHLFLLPEEGRIMSLLSPTTPIPVSDPGAIARYVTAFSKTSARTGKFVEQPEPALFFTVEKMMEYLMDSTGEQLNYQQLSAGEAIQLYLQRGYGQGMALYWCELFDHLNMDQNLLYKKSSTIGDSAAFADLFGKVLSRQWIED